MLDWQNGPGELPGRVCVCVYEISMCVCILLFSGFCLRNELKTNRKWGGGGGGEGEGSTTH